MTQSYILEHINSTGSYIVIVWWNINL